MLRKALFLDRDGVINVDTGYVYRAAQVEFIDGIFDLCRAARAKNYLLIIVTNQAGIGRGYYTEDDFHQLTDWLKQRFAAENAPLDAVYFCPYHPEHGLGEYKKESEDRKPGPGMILRAQREFAIDLGASILIGDKDSDLQAGKRAGVGTLRLFSLQPSPDWPVIQILQEAVLLLENN